MTKTPPGSVLYALSLSLVAATAVGSDSDVGSDGDAARLAAALLGPTPMIEDLRQLTDEIGGRPTGSEANRRAVAWALEKFRQADVEATRETFEMPSLWLEREARAVVRGEGVEFHPRAAAMPYSAATPEGGVTAPLVDGGRGTEADLERLGERLQGAFVLIETEELEDVPGLFREYAENARLERRAIAAGARGVVYMGSRPRDVLHRHNAALGPRNRHPIAAIERDAASRALRLLRAGRALELELHLDLEIGGPYEAENVLGEIRGRERPEEIVVMGAHLDSWGLGTGALDNGCNVALVIDVARQMKRLGLVPRRTVRFALWNGEEQGLYGSWGYVKRHRDALDRHVMASSFDIGNGRITGFFTGGRPEVAAAVERALVPVSGLGPFANVDVPIVGTDHFDFMMEGVANLVANQESATYGPNYHARTDTFDKIDPQQLRLNAAVAAAVIWYFAEMDDVPWERQSRAEIETLIDATDLGENMRAFGYWESWESGERGRQE